MQGVPEEKLMRVQENDTVELRAVPATTVAAVEDDVRHNDGNSAWLSIRKPLSR